MMPTSAHGPSEGIPPHRHGFTLIEVLVVLLIMGLMVGLASLAVRPDDAGALRIEAKRLALLLDLAAQEARLGGRDIAWTSDGQGYRFARARTVGQGAAVEADDLLRPRALPAGMVISGMSIENRRVAGAMRLEFPADGPTMGYQIDLSLGESHFGVAASPVGELTVFDRGEAHAALSRP